MFQAVAIVISVAGMFAIIYTIYGAVSGRSLHIGLILAVFMLVLQVFALGYSAITDPPQDKPASQDSPAPNAEDASAGAGVLVQLG